MLGRFLELSLPTRDIGASWQHWLSLGFAAGEAGDIWAHPYGVVACEGLSIGLHAGGGDEPACLSFVRAGVEDLERELSHRLIGIERAQLGADVFNLLELREPGGTLLRVQEARTFSAPAEAPRHTALGRFRSLSLPCPDLSEARGFWERLGLDVRGIRVPWEGLAVEGMPVTCHAVSLLDEPVLVFDQAEDKADEVALREAMQGAARSMPALRARPHRLMRTAEGMCVLLLGAAT